MENIKNFVNNLAHGFVSMARCRLIEWTTYDSLEVRKHVSSTAYWLFTMAITSQEVLNDSFDQIIIFMRQPVEDCKNILAKQDELLGHLIHDFYNCAGRVQGRNDFEYLKYLSVVYGLAERYEELSSLCGDLVKVFDGIKTGGVVSKKYLGETEWFVNKASEFQGHWVRLESEIASAVKKYFAIPSRPTAKDVDKLVRQAVIQKYFVGLDKNSQDTQKRIRKSKGIEIICSADLATYTYEQSFNDPWIPTVTGKGEINKLWKEFLFSDLVNRVKNIAPIRLSESSIYEMINKY